LVSVNAPRRNIELKARIADPSSARAICESIDAEDAGLLNQRDTYFRTSSGRLKLREEEGSVAQLIAYQRPDHSSQRESQYHLVPVEDAQLLKAALNQGLGVTVTVAKMRHLFLWREVRIHIDRVVDLGDFIEFEAVASADSDLTTERKLVEQLRQRFEIEETDLIASSYSDLLLAAQSNTSALGS
jgi:predicted adenylyl cyclase CyaB